MDDIDDFIGELLGGATIGCLGVIAVLVLVVLVAIVEAVL